MRDTLTLSPIIDSTNDDGVDRKYLFTNKSRTIVIVIFNLSNIKQSTQTDEANNPLGITKALLASSKGVITEEWTYVDAKKNLSHE